MRWLQRQLDDRVPDGFTGVLGQDEHVLASAEADGRALVATSLGLWVPESDGFRRISWHLISKAGWSDGQLSIVEADETGRAGDAVLISDRRATRLVLTRPGKLPKIVRERVNSSIRSSYRKELPGGGAWFVQRKVPGLGRIVLQARADQGVDSAIVAAIAEEAAAKLRR
ncbi:MAG: hypothetical protein ACRDQ7_02340 [Haloechinothrix sp.]